MSEQQSQQSNKKVLIFMSLLGLVVMAVVAFVLTRPPKTEMVTELYKYYPQNTAFYMEVAPGDKLASRFFKSMDKIRTLADSNKQVMHPEIKMAEVVQKNFKPLMSLGVWKSNDSKQESSSAEPSFLAIVPLKDGVTLETLAADLKVPANSYKLTKENDVTLMESKASSEHPFMALHKNNLLISKTKETLLESVKEWNSPGSLVDNPLYKSNLSLLPKNRQGTVLALSTELQDLSPENVKNNDKTFQKVSEFQKQIQAATPVMVGGISIENDQFIHFKSFTPVQLDKIKDADFRKDMQTLFSKEGSFDLASFLPKETVAYGGMVGLGSYYDMYINYIADAEGKKAIESAATQLKMMGLDLRKNIVSLLDGESAIGIIAKKGHPDILLFLNHNEDIKKTLEQFGIMASQMAQGKISDKQVGPNQVVKVLESPAIPIKVGYSNVNPDTVVLGTEEGLENMYEVHQKKQPSLNDNKLFKELASSMPKNASGIFFVDFNQGVALIDDLAKKTPASNAEEKNIKELLSGIEGIAGSNTIDKKMMLHGNLSIKLSSEANP